MSRSQLEIIIDGTKTAVITYRERQMITRFTCIDREQKARLCRPWIVSGLLYGYLDRFNIVTISIDDILHVEV